MEKRLFITDFDGTLLKNDKTISNKDITTLERLQNQKIYTAIATGRSDYSFWKALHKIGMDSKENPLPVDYLIFSTGAGIMEFSSQRTIYQKSIPCSDIKKITKYFDYKKIDYMVHKSIPDTKYFAYKSHNSYNPDFQARMGLYKKYALADQLSVKDGDTSFDHATQVLAIIPDRQDKNFIETIKKELSDFSVIQATSPLDHKSIWIEVFHKSVSKSRAASWLVKRLGISRHNVISVGNDYNDQDLLDWAAKGFVVENSPASLKQRYKTVSSNNQNGVSRAAQESGLT